MLRVPVDIDQEKENWRVLRMMVPRNLQVRDGIRLFYQDTKLFMRLVFHVRRVLSGLSAGLSMSSCRLRLPRRRVCRVFVSR